MWSLLGKRERKFCENCLGHMTKLAAMPIYGKNLRQNTKSYDFETWHVILETQALQMLYK